MEKKVEIVVRARSIAANTLLSALQGFSSESFSEKLLADEWMERIKGDSIIRKCGWYLPPPNGMSILIGNPPNYSRLRYNSLREIENWPSSEIYFSDDSILYPYFSAVDRGTLLLGDFVGTFYPGNDPAIRDWIKKAFDLTLDIARFIEPGQRISDIYNFAENMFNSLGVSNNTYSQVGGLAADIGHSIPKFCENSNISNVELSDTDVASLIAKARWFISKSNDNVLENNFGLTIEPQLIAPKLPMASFHIIVLSVEGKKTIVTEFESLFEYFGMSDWILQ